MSKKTTRSIPTKKSLEEVALQAIPTGEHTHPMMPIIGTYLKAIEAIGTPHLVTRHALPDKTQCTHRRPSLKKKGGRPPVDYAAVEEISDLRDAWSSGNVKEAIVLYAKLSRIYPL